MSSWFHCFTIDSKHEACIINFGSLFIYRPYCLLGIICRYFEVFVFYEHSYYFVRHYSKWAHWVQLSPSVAFELTECTQKCTVAMTHWMILNACYWRHSFCIKRIRPLQFGWGFFVIQNFVTYTSVE